MINTSTEFKTVISGTDRKFYAGAEITLSSGTVLELDNTKIMTLQIEDATSQVGKFTIGNTTINKLTLVIDNLDDSYSQYDFGNAVIRPTVGLQLSSTIETLQKGVFIADDPKSVGNTISITALDYLSKFDKPFSDVLISFPTTAATLLTAVCNYCEVTLATNSFLNDTYQITERPTDEATTCREIVGWIAQLSGNFARCNTTGSLELKWYDIAVFEDNNLDGGTFDATNESSYQSGDTIDGGNFADYTSGDNIDGGTFEDLKSFHHIYALSSLSISTDDVVITGIQVSDNAETTYTVLFGVQGYVINIEGNKLIQSQENATTIANTVGAKIVGMKFRPLSTSAISDPSRESGDVAYVTDRKQSRYQAIISGLIFTIGSSDKITSDAEPPLRNSATRYTVETKAIVEARKMANVSLERAKAYADKLSDALLDELDDTNQAVTNLNTTITTTVADNNIIESEQAAIALQLNLLEKEKLEADNEYSVLYNNANLTGAPKSNLLNAYNGAFNGVSSKYSLLVTSVNNILLATMVATLNTAITAYGIAYTNYKTAIQTYVLAVENASLSIAYKLINDEKTARELAIQNLANELANSSGLYMTSETQPDGSKIYYMHNKPTLTESAIVWKLTANAFGVSTDGGATYPYGFDVTGNAILNRVYAIGINATYITTGKLMSKDGSTLIDLAYGVANLDNISFTENIQSGFPLTMPFNVDGSTSKINSVLLKYTQQAFRTYSTTASSGGGSATTSGASGEGMIATEPVRLFNSTLMAGAINQATGTYAAVTPHAHNMSVDGHQHAIELGYHQHALELSAHTHDVTINPHSHTLNFGIQEQPISDYSFGVYVDGVQKLSILNDSANTQGIVDLTAYITTVGWHTIELRTSTLKRISAQVNIKSYIRS